MTGIVSTGEVVPLPRPAHGNDFAVVPVRAPDGGEADFGNVIPFARPRATDAARSASDVILPTDLARLPAKVARERVRLAAFVAFSLALHGGVFALAMREPPPLASIGLEVISVEIDLGATAPAGIAATPGEQQVWSVAPPNPSSEPDKTEPMATEQPQDIPVAETETAPEQKTQQAQAEPKPSVAMVESPNADTATARPRETPDTSAITLLPQPQEKPAEPKPVQAAPAKPVKNAVPAREQRRIAAPTREGPAKQAKAATRSTAANNVGIGRSNSDTNYPGLVSAHLRHYQQYPADARSRGEQGTATVSFSLDGGGRVASARLARSSGIASIDQEVQAMVRRASPFPAPPAGHSISFTVPVNFRLN